MLMHFERLPLTHQKLNFAIAAPILVTSDKKVVSKPLNTIDCLAKLDGLRQAAIQMKGSVAIAPAGKTPHFLIFSRFSVANLIEIEFERSVGPALNQISDMIRNLDLAAQLLPRVIVFSS